MNFVKPRTVRSLFPAFALAVVACGGEAAAPPAQAPAATSTPSAPEPATTAAPPAAAAPSAASSASPAATAPKASSGRPAVLASDEKEISGTFGSSPGAKLVLGSGKDEVVLRIQEGALPGGRVINFKVDTRGKASGGVQGKIYRVESFEPPSNTIQSIDSLGPPFEFDFPAKKTGNLAIGVEDEKGKVKWTVVAPTRYDESRGVAHFELPSLPAGWIHVTTKPATDKK